MKINVYISTINNTYSNINFKRLLVENLTIINQRPVDLSNKYKETLIDNVTWVDIDQKGLSMSRNFAIEHADSSYVYLTDDDVEIYKGFEKTISEVATEYSEYDVLAFKIDGLNDYETEKDISYRKSLSLSSVQLVYKLDFLHKYHLRFDERFGTGSKYSMGEENIFLFDALKSDAKIKYLPIEIGKLHDSESTWFKGFNQKYFFDRGATYARMFGKPVGFLVSLAFCAMKFKLYKETINPFKAYKSMVRGIIDL